LLCLSLAVARGQSTDSLGGKVGESGKVAELSSHLVSGIQHKTEQLDQQLTSTTQKYLTRMARREASLRRRLSRLDTSGAAGAHVDSASSRDLQKSYMTLLQKMKNDTSAAMN